ncbi:hypothetical protein HG264_04380 [Pseudomonas sp. gcc21]|uniref:hypothetical protein n=1 Tax=Pseudomonas sp. gcc21 TaxID=2726989 RepID=UPI0014529086|nr:hypothetical protein [Pseudomonas sp. gcc21]QJD58203.1 hypothetical protein HG264_04380 [Pseudomonas sp. gcc21]
MKFSTLLATTCAFASVGLSALQTAAVAAPPPGDTATTCELSRSVSENYMRMRQQGVEKETLISNMEEQLGGEIDPDSRAIINSAYEEPINTDDPQKAISDFAQTQHEKCVETNAGT